MVLRHQTGRWKRAEGCQRQQRRNVYFLEVTRTLKRKLCSFILHKKLKFRTPGRFSSGPSLCSNHRVCLLINLCASRKNFSTLTTPTESFWPIKRQFLDTQASCALMKWQEQTAGSPKPGLSEKMMPCFSCSCGRNNKLFSSWGL